jgi:hypothetical protein
MNFDGARPKAFKSNKILSLNNECENTFTCTCEEIQHQCTPILFMAPYFEFKWLCGNVKLEI